MKQIVLQYPLDSWQSERLLEFCLGVGVDCFSMNFVYGNADELRGFRAVESRLAPFFLGKRRLERTVWWNDQRFVEMKCWALNAETIRVVLDACDGSLSNYDMARLPEDWAFYRSGELFLGFVSHESRAFLRMSEGEVEEFRGVGITFTSAWDWGRSGS